jgi:hypothetical protein
MRRLSIGALLLGAVANARADSIPTWRLVTGANAGWPFAALRSGSPFLQTFVADPDEQWTIGFRMTKDTTTPAAGYDLGFFLADCGIPAREFEVLLYDAPLLDDKDLDPASYQTHVFLAPPAGPSMLTFGFRDDSGSWHTLSMPLPSSNSVRFPVPAVVPAGPAVVPAPAGLTILGLGAACFAGLGSWRRWRRRTV